MEIIIGIAILIAIIYFIVWLLSKIGYILAPIAAVLGGITLVIGVLYGFCMSIYCFSKSLIKHINPYTTFVDKNTDIYSGVRRNYFFGPGFHQITITASDAYSALKEQIEKLDNFRKKNTSNPWYISMWVWLFYVIAYLFTYIFGFIWITIFSVTMASIIFMVMCIFYMFFSLLWVSDRLTLIINSIHSRCPNDKRISIVPIFVCPSCGKEHKKLTPGPYGIFYRKCTCNKRLPTTFFNGRSKLKALCPYCPTELATSDARQFGIQLIGGVSVGKTTFLAAFWHKYLEHLKTMNGMRYEQFPNEAFKELEHWYQQGLSSSTNESNANMYSIVHKRGKDLTYQLTVYDIAGEAFTKLGSNVQQQQFKYCEGLIFVIDPTAKQSITNETFSSFINEFKGLKGKHSARMSNTPTAVIISKADLYESEIGSLKISTRYRPNPIRLSETESQARNIETRDLLANHGFENVLNLLEGEFSNVQYYPVSAMGHKGGQPYRPWGVMEPIMWLLSYTDAYIVSNSLKKFITWLKRLINVLVITLILGAFFGGLAYLFFQSKPRIVELFGKMHTKSSEQYVFADLTETYTEKIVNTDGLNVRAGPSPDYPSISTLSKNIIVKVYNRDKEDDWVLINHNNNTVGYVNQNYLIDNADEVKIDQSNPGLYVGNSFLKEMSFKQAFNWINNNAKSNENYTIVIGKDEKMDPINLSFRNLKLNITLKATGFERKVANNTFDIFAIFKLNQPPAPLITVGNGVTLIMENGISFVGTEKSKNQPIIEVNGGTFIMNGGRIRDNNNRAVRIEKGNFIMNYGIISGNTTTGNSSNNAGGGGVVISNDGIFTMNGGSINSNSAFGGGGIFLSSGTFTMNNGIIYNNSAKDEGAGVLVYKGTFVMRNGTISRNTAGNTGGGVRINNTNGESIFTMHNGIISDNKASNNNGGGICVDGVFTLNNGTITRNSTLNYGGGVSIRGTFVMNGGIISGNIASRGGGVNVYTKSEGISFTKSGGIIYGSNAAFGLSNKASSDNYGHAVFSDNGRKRNTTAGENRTMNTGQQGSAGGWE